MREGRTPGFDTQADVAVSISWELNAVAGFAEALERS